jgi:hypothetical protein
MTWTVHHVYECGDPRCATSEKARRFTNLANLVLMSKEYHEGNHGLVHEPSPGADWLKYVIAKLYPSASAILGQTMERPIGSPDVDKVNIAEGRDESLHILCQLRQKEPAGTGIATTRLNFARQGGISAIQQAAQRADRSPRTVTAECSQTPVGRLSRDAAVAKLKRAGYLARQNERSETLFLNLGGPNSELNREDFKGAILLSPVRQQVFGVCPEEVLDFRQLVMENQGGKTWKRRNGVPGPADQRVEVRFVDGDDGEPRIVCGTGAQSIWIDGYGESLCCYDDGYDWADIHSFLTRLKSFCAPCNDH